MEKTIDFYLFKASNLRPEDRTPMADYKWEERQVLNGAHNLYLAIFQPKWGLFKRTKEVLKSNREFKEIVTSVGITKTIEEYDEFEEFLRKFRYVQITHEITPISKRHREISFEAVKGFNFEGFIIKEYERALPYC